MADINGPLGLGASRRAHKSHHRFPATGTQSLHHVEAVPVCGAVDPAM